MIANPKQVKKLLDFFEGGRHLEYKKGSIIVRPEDQPAGIYYIAQGYVKAYSITKYGEENMLIIRKTGELFPLLWAFTGEHREVFYEAMSPTLLHRVSRDDFLSFITQEKEVHPVIIDLAVEMYRTHAERVNSLEYRSVRERIVAFLLSMSHRFGKQTKQGIVITVPLRRHDIAASVNATRETTSRELTSLARKGLIHFDDQLILKNIEGLNKYL